MNAGLKQYCTGGKNNKKHDHIRKEHPKIDIYCHIGYHPSIYNQSSLFMFNIFSFHRGLPEKQIW
ncbi:hypothetical protein CLV42_102572 [Chitinophaga ginsengisoli]|uniref:Uncharacterized protein n=1 Tax=Chitinophaga ginsengisoli TaxID=363837 RepID=A0A2P8GLZ9_9BACT|nr:hypothetical protein CLV42_102572 [Chitinophaga ginsengisoli]